MFQRARSTLSQWASDIRKSVDLDLDRRARDIVRDTKHYALRELTIRRYLQQNAVRKLQIGAGANHLEGWLNTDVLPHSRDTAFLDVRRRFPFDDQTFDYVFSEHVIEHVNFDDGRHMLREIARVLKPGGHVRIVTPDLAALIKLYGPNKDEIQERYIRFITDRFMPDLHRYRDVFVINECVRFSGHQFIYDAPTFEEAMKESGFVGVRSVDVMKSDIPVFNDLASHGAYIGDEDMNRFEAMGFEGQKPA